MSGSLEPVDGVLLFDKPQGMSSNTALQKVRHLFKAQKAGHTGTLDPEATGLLPVCFGEATKFSSYLLDAVKGYTAEMTLGETSNTGDREGEIVPTGRPLPENRAEVLSVFRTLMGPQWQLPPMHSALKMGGKALYQLARQGVEVERPRRPIEIFALDLLAFEGNRLSAHVLCSKGTYVRVLAESIGDALGCGAWLSALRRTQTGGFTLAGAKTLEALNTLTLEARRAALLPVDVLVSGVPALEIDEETARRLKQGQSPHYQGTAPGDGVFRMMEAGTFIGLATLVAGGRLKSVRMMATGDKSN